MKLLIAEEALIDRGGHWFEYISAISRQFRKSGDSVLIAVNQNAQPDILFELGAEAVFPQNAWGISRENPSGLKRLRQLRLHNKNMFGAASKFVEENGDFDVLFVPTILIDHVFGWRDFAKKHAGKQVKKVVLFFVNGQGVYRGPNKPIHFNNSPKKLIFRRALRSLKTEVDKGTVLLGCETPEMAKEYESFCGIPFDYLPHAVDKVLVEKTNREPSRPKTFAHLGFSRFEKGSDLFQSAIIKYLDCYPDANVKFLMQWVKDFEMRDGSLCTKDRRLVENPKVEFIDKALNTTEYKKLLSQTDVMVLPYRLAAYYARVSRVAIEAAINAIPMIYSRDSWNEGLVLDGHGAGVGFEAEREESLFQAIEKSVDSYDDLKRLANLNCESAKTHYSAETFESYLKSLTGFAPKNQPNVVSVPG